MAGFLYFLPAALGATPERISEERFGEVLSMQRCGCKGPEGLAGAICAPALADRQAAQCRYVEKDQAWQGTASGLWIGVERKRPPRPEDLLRPANLGGHPVRLEDDHDWLIPTARLWIDGDAGVPQYAPALPHQMGTDAAGKFRMQPMARYSWLSDQAERFWKSFAEADEQVTMSFEEGWRIAVEALHFNYLVAAEEVSMLGLITTRNIWDVLKALIDWPGYLRVQQALESAAAKKVPAGTGGGSDTANGATDSPPATDRPSPTSSST